MTTTFPDRTVHAVDEQSGVELVRYTRAGKWFLECDYWLDGPLPVRLDEAVRWAVEHDATVHNRFGGTAFQRRYAKRRKQEQQQ